MDARALGHMQHSQPAAHSGRGAPAGAPLATPAARRPRGAVAAASYQDAKSTANNATANSRVELTESLGLSIDTSREAVSTQSVPPPGVRKSFRVSFFDAMKFAGPAPEKINGRLAMLGFLLGSVNELRGGGRILEQAQAAPVAIAATALLFSWASLVPIMKGARAEAFGAFSPRAELTNGRAAMLGFAVLLFLEHRTGVSFF